MERLVSTACPCASYSMVESTTVPLSIEDTRPLPFLAASYPMVVRVLQTPRSPVHMGRVPTSAAGSPVAGAVQRHRCSTRSRLSYTFVSTDPSDLFTCCSLPQIGRASCRERVEISVV